MSRGCAVGVQCLCGAKIVYTTWDKTDGVTCDRADCAEVPPLSREPAEIVQRRRKR